MKSIYVVSFENPPLEWIDGRWDTQARQGLSPEFPPLSGDIFAFYREWTEKHSIEWKMNNSGYAVAKASKAQILDFIECCFGSDPFYNDPNKMLYWEGKPYLVEKLQKCRAAVEHLDDGKLYGLVYDEC